MPTSRDARPLRPCRNSPAALALAASGPCRIFARELTNCLAPRDETRWRRGKGDTVPMTLDGIRILLAEDNPTNQMVAMHMLESLGAEVTLAVDGAEALELLDDRPFDVALIDIEMPRVSGLEVIRLLREQQGAVADMPLIALTAYVMREHRAAIEGAGADAIIAKPIASIERFGDDISRCIQQRRAIEPRPVARPAKADRDASPQIDRDIFDSLWAGFDPAGRRELMSRVSEDIGGACEMLAEAVVTRNFRSIRSATHILISVAGTIGAVRLQELAYRLNSAGHADDDSTLDGHGAQLLMEAESVLKFLQCI